MSLKNIPIRRKLMIIILLTSVTVMLMMRVSFFIFEYVTFRQATIRQLATLAKTIAANSTAALAFENQDDAREILSALKAEPNIAAACLYDKSGAAFSKYPDNLSNSQIPSISTNEGFHFSNSHLTGFQSVTQNGKRLGTLYLSLDTNAIMHDWLWGSINIAVVVMIVVLLIAYLISTTLQKQISEPILSLTETAKAIANRRDFSVRADKRSNDEIGLLTDAFNQMLNQIQEQNRALRESERRFRALIEQSSDGISVIDAQYNIHYLSPSGAAIEGYAPGELVGRSRLDSTHPDDQPAIQENLKRLLDNPGKPFPVQWRRKHKDGRWLWLEGVTTNLLDDPAVRGIVTNYRDITERKQAEEQLLLQATALQTAANAILISDRSGRIQWVNPAFTALTGYSPEEIAGQNPGILKSGKHDEGFYNELWSTILDGRIWRGEFINRRKDGSLYHDEHTIAPVRSKNGEITHFIAIMQDVTERKRNEEEILRLNATLEQRVQERTAQLEAVNKELEAFSYSVSHDLRAPLRHIDGFVEMLRNTCNSTLNDSGKRYLGIISESAKRMGALIDDLLVFSRMGRSEMRRADVNLAELVDETLKEMSRDLEGRNIQWNIAPLPTVNGDRPMLKQVWVNLLSNAVKYTRQREQAQITVNGRKNDRDEWEFSVQDNGAGFDMNYVDKLFGVFQRLHHTEDFEGTGIGLANVRRIILRHGGRTWAEGQVDVGATFYFTLPDTKKDTP